MDQRGMLTDRLAGESKRALHLISSRIQKNNPVAVYATAYVGHGFLNLVFNSWVATAVVWIALFLRDCSNNDNNNNNHVRSPSSPSPSPSSPFSPSSSSSSSASSSQHQLNITMNERQMECLWSTLAVSSLFSSIHTSITEPLALIFSRRSCNTFLSPSLPLMEKVMLVMVLVAVVMYVVKHSNKPVETLLADVKEVILDPSPARSRIQLHSIFSFLFCIMALINPNMAIFCLAIPLLFVIKQGPPVGSFLLTSCAVGLYAFITNTLALLHRSPTSVPSVTTAIILYPFAFFRLITHPPPESTSSTPSPTPLSTSSSSLGYMVLIAMLVGLITLIVFVVKHLQQLQPPPRPNPEPPTPLSPEPSRPPLVSLGSRIIEDAIGNAYSVTIRYLESELRSPAQLARSPAQLGRSPAQLSEHDRLRFQTCLSQVQQLEKEWREKDPKPQTKLPHLVSKERELPKYEWSQIQLREQIGNGAESEVRMAVVDGDQVAVKILNSHSNDEEAIILWKNFVSHPNVAKLRGLVEPSKTIPRYGLITYIYRFGDLGSAVFPPDTTHCRKYFSQIASGLAHLHRQKIIHQDLARRNVLVSHTGQVILTDFGLSVKVEDIALSQLMPSKKISLEMLAPEVCQSLMEKRALTTSERRDMWALGVVIWETVMHKPYALNYNLSNPEDQQKLYKAILDGAVLPLRDVVLKVGFDEPKIVVALIGCKQPKETRLTAEEVRLVLGGKERGPEEDGNDDD